jgi:integral membrane sensor domain MASE1
MILYSENQIIYMRQEDRLQLIWAVTFIMSGVIFALAFWFTPVIGTLAALGYIIMYVGLSMAFLVVFRSMTKLNTEFVDTLKNKKNEIEQMKKSIERKYLKKRIDEQTYKRLAQDYEQQLTELEVKIKNLKRI